MPRTAFDAMSDYANAYNPGTGGASNGNGATNPPDTDTQARFARNFPDPGIVAPLPPGAANIDPGITRSPRNISNVDPGILAPLPEPRSPMAGPHPADANWDRFLFALSGPESSFGRNQANPTSSARGWLQDIAGTRNQMMRQGLGDPWAGGRDQQFAVNRRYIERNFPQAAAAIARGDWQTAIRILRPNQWPSLPGGPQSTPQGVAMFERALRRGPPQSFFGNPYPATPSEYGQPDSILKTAQSTPGLGPSGYMPQPNELTGVLQQAMSGLMQNGSGRIAPMSLATMQFYANYLIAQRKGQTEAAKIQHARFQDQFKETLDAQQIELSRMGSCFAEAEKTKNPIGEFQTCMAQYSDSPNDPALQRAYQGPDQWARIKALLDWRHDNWLKGSKVKSQSDKQAETDTERRDWLDPDPDSTPTDQPPATSPGIGTTGTAQDSGVPQGVSTAKPFIVGQVYTDRDGRRWRYNGGDPNDKATWTALAAQTPAQAPFPSAGTAESAQPAGTAGSAAATSAAAPTRAVPPDVTPEPDGSFPAPSGFTEGETRPYTDANGNTTNYTVTNGRMVPAAAGAPASTPSRTPAGAARAAGGVQPVPQIPGLKTDAAADYRRPPHVNPRLEAAVQDYVAGNTEVMNLLPKDPAIRSAFSQRVFAVEQQLESIANSNLCPANVNPCQPALDAVLRVAPQFGQKLAGYISGATSPPRTWNANKPPYELMIPIGQKVDRTFSEQVFASRASAVRDFGSGRDGQQLTAYGTALLHSQATRKLLPNKPGGILGIPGTISAENYMLSNWAPEGWTSGQGWLSAYNQSIGFLAPEAAKAAMSGNKPFEAEIRDFRGELEPSRNTTQISQALDVIDQRLAAKGLELKERWLAMTGKPLTDLVKLFNQNDPYGYGDYQGTTHAQRVYAIAHSLGIQ